MHTARLSYQDDLASQPGIGHRVSELTTDGDVGRVAVQHGVER